MKKLFTKQDHWRRYRLHERIKKLYKVSSLNRQVIVKHTQIEQAKGDKRITELCQRFRYNIQTEIS